MKNGGKIIYNQNAIRALQGLQWFKRADIAVPGVAEWVNGGKVEDEEHN